MSRYLPRQEKGNYIIVIVILVILSMLPLFVHLTQKQTRTRLFASGSISLTGIHVVGNTLQNSLGQNIILHGANRSGTEYACMGTGGFSDGPIDSASVQAMANWNINAIRVPLNEDCWLGINGATIGGTIYQQDVLNWVNTITSQGMVAILDLHWNAPGTFKAQGQEPMADNDHAPAFWSGVASTFKNNSMVLFDLYNEPDPVPYSSSYPGGFNAWQEADFRCVRDGCTASATQGVSYPTVGMQSLVNTVRSTGATNVIMIGGIQSAQTITQYQGNNDTTNSYMPTDSLNNLVVSQHQYPAGACSNINCWDSTVIPVGIRYPIITGEFGDTGNNGVCTNSYTTTLLPWLDSQNISYLAWTWNTTFGCQSLVTDYTGTPTSLYGQAVHDHYVSLGPTISPSLIPTATPLPTLLVLSPTPSVSTRILGDLNPTPDGKVCIDDLSILAKDWTRGPAAFPPTTFFNPLSDINGDGVVNIIDLSILAKHWQC